MYEGLVPYSYFRILIVAESYSSRKGLIGYPLHAPMGMGMWGGLLWMGEDL